MQVTPPPSVRFIPLKGRVSLIAVPWGQEPPKPSFYPAGTVSPVPSWSSMSGVTPLLEPNSGEALTNEDMVWLLCLVRVLT